MTLLYICWPDKDVRVKIDIRVISCFLHNPGATVHVLLLHPSVTIGHIPGLIYQ